MKIKIKTEKELKKMFMLEVHKDPDDNPLSFSEYVEYIPRSMFGKSFQVVDASKSTFFDCFPFIDAFPSYFVVDNGQCPWYVSSKFIKAVEL